MVRFTRLFRGADSNVGRVLAYRIWTVLAGLITIYLIPNYLTAEEQGYFYTFMSIVAIQALFDLGLSQAISQISSHEFAHILQSEGLLDTNNPHAAKLIYIKEFALRWYRWIAFLFIGLVSAVGSVYFFFLSNSPPDFWLWPWLLMVCATGLNIVMTPRLAMVEAAGFTGRVAMVRLVQSLLGYGLLATALFAGCGLWSVAAVPAAACMYSFLWLSLSQNPYRLLPRSKDYTWAIKPWKDELIGLQWRVALSWLGGYLAAHSIVPIVFAFQGAAQAGQIGLGLQIFSVVQTLGMSWVNAKIPFFGQLISTAKWNELRVQFIHALSSAIAVAAIFAISVNVLLELARHFEPTMGARLPSPTAIIVLGTISTLNTGVYAMAAYMRAHKEEPLVISSLVIGAATALATLIAAQVSVNLVVVSYAAVTLLLNTPWTAMIFARYWKRNRLMQNHE